MRTYEELKTEIELAITDRDAGRVRAVGSEAERLGSIHGAALVRYAKGYVAEQAGDFKQALTSYDEAIALYHSCDERAGEADAAVLSGNILAMTAVFPAALERYYRVRALYHELGGTYGEARCVGNMGNVYFALGEFDQALEHHRQALAVHEESNNVLGAACVMSNIGNVSFATGDYPQALEWYRRAEAALEQLGDHASVATIVGNLGNVFAESGDPQRALEQFQKALELHREVGDRDGVATVTGNIGNLLSTSGDHAQALQYLERAFILHGELGDQAGMARANGNMISALIAMGRFDEAEERLRVHGTLETDDPVVLSGQHVHRALFAERRGDHDTANHELHEALEIATACGARSQNADVHERLRALARVRGDFAGYVEHNEEYLRIAEEIRGKTTIQRLATLEADRSMEAERREREKERAVLYSTLPKNIADRIVHGEAVTGDHYPHAAVLFADIVEFTTHSASLDPGDIVMFLDDLFATFDEITAHHGIVKIKTMGDSYICFKGDGTAEENARAVADAAIEIRHTVAMWPATSASEKSPVEFRLGAHIGPVTAGVIGKQRLQ
jgi:tetratricopeptide (TPR) repeat protein